MLPSGQTTWGTFMTEPTHILQEEPQGPEVFLVYLHNNKTRRLPMRLLQRIEHSVLILAASTTHGQARTLKEHFGSKAWKDISNDQPVLAGYCMAYLVANRRVPFRAMGIHPSSKAMLYALI